jgi:acetyltransferase-like isoleucine patch superfamily enzyme
MISTGPRTPEDPSAVAPPVVGAKINRGLATARIVASRLRALRYRLMGATIGDKCLFGPRVRLDLAWRIQVGPRTQLEADVWLKLVSPQAQVIVGEYTFLGRGVEIDAAAQVTVGSHVLIAPGVFITDHNHNLERGTLIREQGWRSSPVVIGDDVWIGARAIVLPGVTVGTGAVVGAASVVRENVSPGAIVAGVPARVLRDR